MDRWIDKIQAVLLRIDGVNIRTHQTTGGILITTSSVGSSIPKISLILNQLGGQQTIRCEIIGNITQYVVDDFVTNLQNDLDFRIIYLEVTDPTTGQIKYKLSINKIKKSSLYNIYRKEIFKFHYPREDGRLILLLDQGKIILLSRSKQEPQQATHFIRRSTKIKKTIQTEEAKHYQPTIENNLSKTLSENDKLLSDSGLTENTEKSEIPDYDNIPKTPDNFSDQSELILKGKSSHSKVERDQVSDIKLGKRNKQLPLTQKEQNVLKLVNEKPNKKVQSKGLKKELSWDQETIRNVLRSLVAKDHLYVRAAWYIVKEADEDLVDFKSKIPLDERLSRMTSKERKIYDILATRLGRKAQARMLIRESKMAKDNLKKLLRNMVAKEILYVYAAWYIIKD